MAFAMEGDKEGVIQMRPKWYRDNTVEGHPCFPEKRGKRNLHGGQGKRWVPHCRCACYPHRPRSPRFNHQTCIGGP